MLLKIFSYNIHGLPIISDSWCTPIAEWFNGTDYDFICLQEVFTQRRVEMVTKSLEANGYTVLKPNDFKKRKNLFSSGLITAVKKDSWSVISETFVDYTASAGVELFANKGFHSIRVRHTSDVDFTINLINTHMQSDNPTNYFAGCIDTNPIRRLQALQIYEFIKSGGVERHFLVGDLNSESETHTSFLYLTGQKNGIKKHTFPETGEDLDHVAILPNFWLPYTLPVIKTISVLTKLKWSDHWPIHVSVNLK